MKVLFSIFVFVFLINGVVRSQNNALVIQNNAFLVINGGGSGSEAVLVVNQPNANGIITSGTGGNIITQGEFDYVKWNVRTNTGSYVVPFTTDVANVKIPLTINISSAGTGTGYIAMSSWDVSTGAGSFNNTPYPSEVVHMAGANGQADVSEYAVDRFWIMDINDPLGTGETFGTEPVATYNFGYNTAIAETADGNMLAVGNLGAQRYDGATDKWHGWFSGTPAVANAIWGTDDASGNVTGVAPAGPWFRTWTLADISEPLPVTLTSFEGACKDEGVVLNWETASELNNDHFKVLKSLNGVDFNVIAQIPGAGSQNVVTQYTFVDAAGTSSASFYRIAQIDFDGQAKNYDPIKIEACNTNQDFNVYSAFPGEIVLELDLANDEDFQVIIYDALGKQVSNSQFISAQNGFNQFKLNYNDVAFGNYLVTLQNDTKTLSKKLILK